LATNTDSSLFSSLSGISIQYTMQPEYLRMLTGEDRNFRKCRSG